MTLMTISATAWIAAGCSAFYLPSVYYEGLILKTALAMFLATVVLWGVARSDPDRPGPAWIGIGVALGAACLTRGNLVLFVPFFLAWVLLDSPGPSGSRRLPQRARWITAGLVLAGCAALLLATAATALLPQVRKRLELC